MGSTDCAVIQAMVQAGKTYADHCAGLEPKDKPDAGSPQWFVWRSMLGAVREMASAEDGALISQHLDKLDHAKDVQQYCRWCQVEKCHDKSQMRVLVAVSTAGQAVWDTCKGVMLAKASMKEKMGRAPRGENERKIQQMLDEIEG